MVGALSANCQKNSQSPVSLLTPCSPCLDDGPADARYRLGPMPLPYTPHTSSWLSFSTCQKARLAPGSLGLEAPGWDRISVDPHAWYGMGSLQYCLLNGHGVEFGNYEIRPAWKMAVIHGWGLCYDKICQPTAYLNSWESAALHFSERAATSHSQTGQARPLSIVASSA